MKNKNIEADGYNWVKCKAIDDFPVLTEFYDREWYFCGIKKSYGSNDVEILSEEIKIIRARQRNLPNSKSHLFLVGQVVGQMTPTKNLNQYFQYLK